MSLVVRIALLRPLARLGPHRWGPRLAEALVTRSHQVSGLPGSTVRRTAAAKEAVALCRRLAAERPDQHRVALARALVARAAAPDTAPASEAIDQLHEAIGYVEDAEDRCALVVLATARGLLALNLHQGGEVREALTLALRARATWDVCGPLRPLERMRLARALLVIGGCHEALGRSDEANTVRRQAWELHRALSAYRRSQWITVGATAATDLAQGLTVTGPAREALDLIEESRADVEVLSRFQPRQGRPLLARAMLIEAECRAQLDDPDRAVRLAEQAVDRQRAMVAAETPGSVAALAHGLLVLGNLAARAGREGEAVAHLTEATTLARNCHDDVLARALFELVDLRVAAGDRAAVEELLAEAVPLCREHAGRFPEVWRSRLARALLMRCGLTVFALPATAVPSGSDAAAPDGTSPVYGPDGDGLAAGREAVELARSLAGADPAYRELLGRCLFTLARAVHLAGDPRESGDLLRECVAVRRELFSADPVEFRLRLAEALCDLGNRTHALDRLDEAVGIYRECLDLLRADPERIDQAELLTPLRNLGRTLWRLDRKDEAARVWDEIVAVEELVGTSRSGPSPRRE
ncbi:tetratricopeptide repeat protein [Micromonospora sp. AP08]|uniref:tetratricopeptide repeat protein n=1 Tax=Micromonospora sp. AP08 TaxID=2604467 RepID=UPI0011D7C65B|nr:tetratricopeptide repeat protein [Micromonospora sp. AP08]TYB38118.1 tetratricopeptide repeat protein [Micromonospora sp. AP08]